MNLYILRHAIAAHPGEAGTPKSMGDVERPLTEEGRRKMERVAHGMKSMELRFDRVLTSPLVRAMQTAEIVMEVLDIPGRELVVTENLSPGGSRKELIREVNRISVHAGNIVLVGHEPDLSSLIDMLCTGGIAASFEMKKGGLAKLEVERLRNGRCAKLAWLLAPKQLRLMG